MDVTDEDGDTPLYTVENVDTAQWLVEHGATVHQQNSEGVSVSQFKSYSAQAALTIILISEAYSPPLRGLPAGRRLPPIALRDRHA